MSLLKNLAKQQHLRIIIVGEVRKLIEIIEGKKIHKLHRNPDNKDT